MARKDDLKLLFNFMIELLKDETDETKTVDEKIVKKLIVEEQKPTKFDIFDVPRIKTIMEKMESNFHENSIVKQALNTQTKDYKKEIEELKDAFNKRVLKEDKLEDEKFSGGTESLLS
jgi:heme-binding NEAT domain protein